MGAARRLPPSVSARRHPAARLKPSRLIGVVEDDVREGAGIDTCTTTSVKPPATVWKFSMRSTVLRKTEADFAVAAPVEQVRSERRRELVRERDFKPGALNTFCSGSDASEFVELIG
jgi:hypothetical protein